MHGANDAQKTMGIIAVLLFANHLLGSVFHVPMWVVLSCYGAISIGTLAGGWRVVRTVGQKVTDLDRPKGFAAEFGAGLVLGYTAHAGIPVSTTHAVMGSVAGVGVASGQKVHWSNLSKIGWAWVLTIPFAALVSGITYYLIVLIAPN
jgi:PiT family inorganic phosphate transporter